jgi:hypothetical protein
MNNAMLLYPLKKRLSLLVAMLAALPLFSGKAYAQKADSLVIPYLFGNEYYSCSSGGAVYLTYWKIDDEKGKGLKTRLDYKTHLIKIQEKDGKLSYKSIDLYAKGKSDNKPYRILLHKDTLCIFMKYGDEASDDHTMLWMLDTNLNVLKQYNLSRFAISDIYFRQGKAYLLGTLATRREGQLTAHDLYSCKLDLTTGENEKTLIYTGRHRAAIAYNGVPYSYRWEDIGQNRLRFKDFIDTVMRESIYDLSSGQIKTTMYHPSHRINSGEIYNIWEANDTVLFLNILKKGSQVRIIRNDKSVPSSEKETSNTNDRVMVIKRFFKNKENHSLEFIDSIVAPSKRRGIGFVQTDIHQGGKSILNPSYYGSELFEWNRTDGTVSIKKSSYDNIYPHFYPMDAGYAITTYLVEHKDGKRKVLVAKKISLDDSHIPY